MVFVVLTSTPKAFAAIYQKCIKREGKIETVLWAYNGTNPKRKVLVSVRMSRLHPLQPGDRRFGYPFLLTALEVVSRVNAGQNPVQSQDKGGRELETYFIVS